MNHITDILDNTRFAELTESELSAIRAHAPHCSECANTFAAARVSSLLLRERVSLAANDAANANPFFQTRVLAQWREQQTSVAWSLRRLWSATGAIVASMAATTAALAVLMFVAPANTPDQQTASLVPYSAETVVLEQDRDDNQLTNDQVISAIYDDDDEGK